MKKPSFVAAALLACAALAATANAQTAAAYPSKPIRMVVPYPAGGGVDAIARQLGKKMGEALGQAVTVDNRPGAGAIIGLDAVAKAAPDGYTVLFTAGSSINLNPHVYKKLPYDPAKDLQPVAQTGNTPLLLLVSATNPSKTLAEFVAAAKAKPGTASFGSYGNGTTGHLLGAAFGKSAGIDLLHVPFKGAAPALTDLIGGNVTSVVADLGSARGLIQGGKVRPLAQTGAMRDPALPNVPTFAEAGQPSLAAMTGWLGVFVPARTPKDITDKLAGTISKVLQTAELKASMAELGYTATGLSGAKFEELVRTDTDRWGKAVKDMGGITLD
ncbi:tripartite tricarboxylate transporter substrate binding protein [Variovorax sp. dw_954]|uniref:Bug family tripartite tricarboxylate transporter substrate binding protein n=1 Tax=Variovorax sp. dw_954 TaxID=2720078 RepID=UPI001BD2B2F6|nr:tripartite tricarboxylate transporter substrate binding protein [Variovorax sp. dw_954]